MNNPIQQMMMMAKQGQNPQQMMLQFLQQQAEQSPMGKNLLGLAQQGKYADIEKIVRNICAQRGIDFDKEFTAFKQQLGL